MDLISIAKLPLSTDQGWRELARHRPPIREVFGFLVLPLALLPPAMLYFAGAHDLEKLVQATPQKDWTTVAAVCFLAEMATFVAMGWLIKQVAATYSFSIDYHDAYLLAAIAPVPVRLASLALFVPDLVTKVMIFFVTLGVSCALMYHGLQALGRRYDEVVAARIVHIVIGADLMFWALLFVLAFV